MQIELSPEEAELLRTALANLTITAQLKDADAVIANMMMVRGLAKKLAPEAAPVSESPPT